MDFDYYGISSNIRDKLIAERRVFIVDYWKDGRHFSRHKSKDRGSHSRIVDKNIYENLRLSFYTRNPHYEHQGVFNGYRQNEFITPHLDSKYLLIVDFKNCYRNITFDHFSSVIQPRMNSIQTPLPMDLVETLYFPHGYLQAGLSSSNIICDMVLKYNFDKKINAYIHNGSQELGYYSRYYDDLYISSDDVRILKDMYKLIKALSKNLSMPLNYKKCQIRRVDGAKILGSRVSGGKIRISRPEKNNLRAAIYELENTSRENIEYEHRLRSVIFKLSRICNTEANPNKKYKDSLDDYREELDDFTKTEELHNVIEL